MNDESAYIRNFNQLIVILLTLSKIHKLGIKNMKLFCTSHA